MVKRLFIAWLVLNTLSYSWAQDCSTTLEQARTGFGKGDLYTIPALLKPCLENGFNKVQKIEGYLILTRTYLLIDDPISAEESYLNLLSLDPEYEINSEVDPVDIVYLDKKFTTTPIFIVFAKVGFNAANASVIQNYGTDNTSSSQEGYKASYGFNIGAGIELNINESLSLGTELNFSTRNYEYTNTLFNGDTQTFIESQSLIDFPFFLKYRFQYKKFSPYFYGGFALNYLLASNAEVELIDLIELGEDESSEFSVKGPQENISTLRESLNRFVFAGIGTRYRIGYNYLLFDIRYYYGLNNFVNQEGQYTNNALLYQYGYVDDLKRMESLSISIGFIKPLYKPRKIENKKGFFKRLFK